MHPEDRYRYANDLRRQREGWGALEDEDDAERYRRDRDQRRALRGYPRYEDERRPPTRPYVGGYRREEFAGEFGERNLPSEVRGDGSRAQPRERRGYEGERRFDEFEGGHGRADYDRGDYGEYGAERGFDRDRRPWGGERAYDERGSAYGARSAADYWTRPPDRFMDRAFLGQPRGPHAGKGPRGYVRSDERIREDVMDALTRDPDVDATDLEVMVARGEVTITGAVDDRREKRSAEACAERVEGVKDVHNQIRVRSAADAEGRNEQRFGRS